jgi:hypothetical protein
MRRALERRADDLYDGDEMPDVENDQTKHSAQPAVIVANIRSGGTFLAHCLSNHPQIFCDRGESLHHFSVWHTYLRVQAVDLLHCLLHMQGYCISMCKLTYTQTFHDSVWEYLGKLQPRVIWLRRENVIRQAVSALLNKLARSGEIVRPQHTFESVPPARIAISPETIIEAAREMVQQDHVARAKMANFKTRLEMTYAEMIGGEQAAPDELTEKAARRLCEFLGVRTISLSCELKRVNPAPLRETLTNWPDVESAVRASDLAHCLKDEVWIS